VERQVADESVYDDWKVTAHRRDMRVGERVYFRRTVGTEPAGITAVGRLISPVYATSNTKRPFQVDVMYEMRVVPPLTREDVQDDDILREYWALGHGQAGTTFLLPPQVAAQVEELVKGRLKPFASIKPEVNPDPQHDERRRGMIAVVQRQGQPEFRRRLVEAYGGKCAITGCDALQALEAAHIRPFRGRHTNDVTNGLLLRADIHTLFDQELLTIDTATMTVLLHPDLMATTYAQLAGTPLRSPQNPSMRPSSEALDEHRQQTSFH
jgi:hypothetical protein